jgi:hypothetical protein
MAEVTAEPVRITQRTLPTAFVDRQVQDLVDRAVVTERERCVAVVHAELAKWDARRGVGWTWEKCRDNILAAVNMVERR